MKKTLAIALVLGIGVGGYAIGNLQNSGNEVASTTSVSTPASSATTSVELGNPPADPQAALAWNALMDPTGEYAAFAMYTAVIDKYGEVEPYTTIRSAEQRHIDALIRQLDRYGITAPENPYLGQVSAPADLTSAAKAWATGETDNVALYEGLLTKTTDANLIKVFNNLKTASLEVHLPLFEQAAQNGGQLTNDQRMTLMHS